MLLGTHDDWSASEYAVAKTDENGEIRLQFPGKQINLWQRIFSGRKTIKHEVRLWILPQSSSLIRLSANELDQMWMPVIRVGLDPVNPTVDKPRSLAPIVCNASKRALDALLQLTQPEE